MTTRKLIALTACALFAAPVHASAATASGDVTLPAPPALVVGLLGLSFAIVLLVEVVALRNVAKGSAVADNITYVVLGTLCLAASVLASWIPRVVDLGADSGDVRGASDGLVLVSMAFFAIYFFRVKVSLQRFLRVMSAEDALAAAQIDAAEDGDGLG
jgi:hypothetical protein